MRCYLICVLSCTFVFSISAVVFAQTDRGTPLSSITEDRRSSFNARIQQLVSSDRDRDDEAIYHLLASEQRNAYKSIAEFIDFRKKTRGDLDHLLEFRTESVNRLFTSDDYLVQGCGSFLHKGEIKNYEARVIAVDELGDWKFRSTIGPILSQGTFRKKECSIKK